MSYKIAKNLRATTKYWMNLSVGSTIFQACLNLLLLRRELQHKLSQSFMGEIGAPGSVVPS